MCVPNFTQVKLFTLQSPQFVFVFTALPVREFAFTLLLVVVAVVVVIVAVVISLEQIIPIFVCQF